MQTVTAQFLQTLRGPHKRISRAVHRNLITGGPPTTLPIQGGAVTVDANAANRRMLSLSLPALQRLWDTLDTVGGEITVTQQLCYTNGARESVPLGVFIVDTDQIGYGPDDTIQLTCPDRWGKVQKNNFGLSRSSVPGNAAYLEIKRLVEACWGGSYPFPGWSTLDTTATTKVGPLVWDDGNRAAAIAAIATDNSLEVFFDATGLAVLRPIPVLHDTSPPVWRVDAGSTGVLVKADRTRDRTRLHNAIILTTSATDVTFAPVEVKNTTGGDPLNVTGPLGYVPLNYSSPTLRNSGQALAAGLTMLSKNLGIAKQLQLESAGNPALDARDVVDVVLPTTDAGLPRPTELHIIDSVTHPLMPADTQPISTRSTRPDTDGT